MALYENYVILRHAVMRNPRFAALAGIYHIWFSLALSVVMQMSWTPSNTLEFYMFFADNVLSGVALVSWWAYFAVAAASGVDSHDIEKMVCAYVATLWMNATLCIVMHSTSIVPMLAPLLYILMNIVVSAVGMCRASTL